MTKSSITLEQLFIELVKIETSSFIRLTKSMLCNTVKYFADMDGFNTKPLIYWHCVASSAGIRYNVED